MAAHGVACREGQQRCAGQVRNVGLLGHVSTPTGAAAGINQGLSDRLHTGRPLFKWYDNAMHLPAHHFVTSSCKDLRTAASSSPSALPGALHTRMGAPQVQDTAFQHASGRHRPCSAAIACPVTPSSVRSRWRTAPPRFPEEAGYLPVFSGIDCVLFDAALLRSACSVRSTLNVLHAFVIMKRRTMKV